MQLEVGLSDYPAQALGLTQIQNLLDDIGGSGFQKFSELHWQLYVGVFGSIWHGMVTMERVYSS